MSLSEIDIRNGLKPINSHKKPPNRMFTFEGSAKHFLDEKTFIWLWQISESLESFGAKISVINYNLQQRHAPDKEIGAWGCPHITDKPSTYISRASSYKRRGIPMRELKWENQNWKERKNKLIDYAQKLLDK